MALIIFRDFLKLILYLSFLSILLVTGTLGKIFVQDNVINEDTLSNWAGNDKYRKSRATEFNERCLAQSAPKEKSFAYFLKSKGFSARYTKSCAKDNGYNDIYEDIYAHAEKNKNP